MVAMFLFLRIGKEANLLSDWKYEVKTTAVGNVTAGIDCHAVSGGQEHTCRDPATGGGVSEASRDARNFKNQILKGNCSAFWLKSAIIANRQNDFPSHNSSQNLKKIKTIFLVYKNFQLSILSTGKPSVQSETNRWVSFVLTVF